jgi:hypothetical protein
MALIRLRRLDLVLLVLAWLGLASPLRAAAFDFNDGSWEGSRELLTLARARLGLNRVILVATLDFAALKPGDGILIMHPTVTLNFDSLSEFMRSGGRIAILDDYGSSGPFLERFGIRRTNPPLRPVQTLRSNANLAWASPTQPPTGVHGPSAHSIVSGLARLLTNHPTTFSNPGLTPILEIRAIDGSSYPLAISGVIGQRGRLFVMGDPSAVINLMLRYPENRQFAEHLVDYLLEDDTWGVRGGKLYLVANEFAQFTANNEVPSPQHLARRFWDICRTFARWQIPQITAWVLGILVTAAVGRMAWLKLGAKVKSYRPRFVLPTPLVAQPGEAGRAAVLAAPSTPRMLAFLELMSGATAYLTAYLGLVEGTGMANVFDNALENRLLNQTQRDELQRLITRVANIRAALSSGGQTRVRAKELRRAHRLILDITKGIDHRQRL